MNINLTLVWADGFQIPVLRQAFNVGSNFRMTQSSNIKFIELEKDNVLNELASVDKELKRFLDNYMYEEYKGDKKKRLDYIDIGFIARFLVDKLKVRQTEMFQLFFEKVEIILKNCDNNIENLIVIGLFESIQNNCGTDLDYHCIFNSWLRQLSKIKWDTLIDNWEGEEWRTKYINKL